MNRRNLYLAAILAAIFGVVWLMAPDGGQVVAKFDGTPPTTPAEVDALPEGADFGYSPDVEATKEFLQAMPGGKYSLRDQAPELFVGDDKQSVVLYPALYIAYEQRYPGSKWAVGSQGIGDCVSWGWKHGVDIHLAVLKRTGEVSEWREVATEAIYGGSRVEARGRRSGGWSDGSYGSAAAKFVRDWGVVFRQDYRDRAGSETDLSRYSSSKAKQWGNYGCGGKDDDGRLDGIAKEHPIKTVALVTTWEETKAAIGNGYPVPVCSGQGFSSTRDKDGFAAARGSWSHCFPPGTVISTITPTTCENVKIGDRVVTASGNVQAVDEVFERHYSGPMVVMRGCGVGDVRSTPEHPMLIYRPMRSGPTFAPGQDLATYGGGKYGYLQKAKAEHDAQQPQWVYAGNVQAGDYFLVPDNIKRSDVSIPAWPECPRAVKQLNALTADDDVAFLFGYYVADGSVKENHGIQITLPKQCDELDRLHRAVGKLGLTGRVDDHGTYQRLYVDSVVIAKAFADWFGTSSETKRFPEFVFGEGWDWRALLEGYSAGDGCEVKPGRVRVTTVCQSLAQQVWLLAVSTHQYPMMYDIPADRPGVYANAKPSKAIEFGKELKAHSTRYWNGYYCIPIRSVEAEQYDGPVYNFEVPGDHTYLADGVAVHNCMVAIGIRFDREGVLILNSWGPNWIRGPKWPGDQPDGSFWCDRRTWERMIAGRDSFAVSGFTGFPARRLKNAAGW